MPNRFGTSESPDFPAIQPPKRRKENTSLAARARQAYSENVGRTITQAEISAQLRVSLRVWSSWENGERRPSGLPLTVLEAIVRNPKKVLEALELSSEVVK